MGKARGIITGSLVITMLIGVLNSIYKYDKLPSFRFFFGNGVLFLMLSGLAEFEEEIAKALALAIVTFTVLGEGGGVLDHFLGSGTSKTTLNTDPSGTKQIPAHSQSLGGGPQGAAATVGRRETGLPAVSLNATKPILPVNALTIHNP